MGELSSHNLYTFVKEISMLDTVEDFNSIVESLDKALVEISGQKLVDSNKMADFLLDIRQAVLSQSAN
jgi:hypothetical protein